MEKFQTKLLGFVVALLVITFIIPTQVSAATENLQIIKTNNEDYVIYVKDLKEQFEYAIVQDPNIKEIDINYQKSKKDDDNNQVILVTSEEYEQIKDKDNYLFVKLEGKEIIKNQKLDFSKAFTVENMRIVETSTRRINTDLITDIIEKDEEINGVKVKITVGGLKITKQKGKTYYYTITKLPTVKYDTLKELADEINANYENIDMYSKIELTKKFYEAYTDLVDEQNWLEVEDYTIMQPNDAQKGEQYVVFLKEVNKNQEETIDVKFMTSYREDEEEKIPGRTETKVVKETTKLPITGDSIVLFVILAVILIVAIIVFIRMKKLENKKSDK